MCLLGYFSSTSISVDVKNFLGFLYSRRMSVYTYLVMDSIFLQNLRNLIVHLEL